MNFTTEVGIISTINADIYSIADSTEAWVMHVTPASAEGSSSVWAAQKVPEGHFTIVADVFTIREIDLSDKTNFV